MGASWGLAGISVALVSHCAAGNACGMGMDQLPRTRWVSEAGYTKRALVLNLPQLEGGFGWPQYKTMAAAAKKFGSHVWI